MTLGREESFRNSERQNRLQCTAPPIRLDAFGFDYGNAGHYALAQRLSQPHKQLGLPERTFGEQRRQSATSGAFSGTCKRQIITRPDFLA